MGAAVLLALAAGAVYLVQRYHSAHQPSPRTRRATDFTPTPIVPLADMPWPSVSPDSRGAHREATAAVSKALSLYSEAEQSAAAKPPNVALFHKLRTAADTTMTQGLDRLEAIGALLPELAPYHMRTVETALAAQNFPEARQRLERWLAKFPGDYDHRLELGKVLFQVHRWAPSAESFRRAAAGRPASLEARHWLAEVCFQMGTSEEGVRATREGLSLLGFPSEELWDHPMGKTFLGNSIKVLHRFREYGLLAELARFYRRRDPTMIEATMAEGVALVHLGRYASAEPLLRQAMEDSTNRDEVIFTLGLALAKQSKWREAASSFASLLSRQPFFVRAYYQLGLCLARLGRSEQADLLFARSQDLAPSERELRRGRELAGVGQPGRAAVARSRGYRLRGQYDEAEKALRKRDLRENPFAVVALAELYIDDLRAADAERVLAHAATLIDPDHIDIQSNRARLLFLRGEEANAIAHLARSVARPTATKHWRLLLGKLLLETGRYDKAAAVFRAAGQGTDGESLYHLGRALLLNGEPAPALEALRNISRGDKRWKRWRGDLWLAWALAAGGEGEASLEEARTLLAGARESERTLRAHLGAQLALYERSSTEASQLELVKTALARYDDTRQQVASLKNRVAGTAWPASGPHYLSLARLLAARGERSEAIRYARLARWATGDSPQVLRTLADWLTDGGDVFFRMRVLRDLSERSPGDAELQRQLAQLDEEWRRF